jgi:recombination protein RecA
MFGNPTTTQGGHALKFYSDVRIEVSKSLAKEGDEVFGNITKIKVIKNKMSAPYKLCSFNIIYGLGIDKAGEILALLHDLEIGKKYGQTFTFKEIKYPLDTFIDMLSEEDFYKEITESIVDKINNKTPIDESTNQEAGA